MKKEKEDGNNQQRELGASKVKIVAFLLVAILFLAVVADPLGLNNNSGTSMRDGEDDFVTDDGEDKTNTNNIGKGKKAKKTGGSGRRRRDGGDRRSASGLGSHFILDLNQPTSASDNGDDDNQQEEEDQHPADPADDDGNVNAEVEDNALNAIVIGGRDGGTTVDRKLISLPGQGDKRHLGGQLQERGRTTRRSALTKIADPEKESKIKANPVMAIKEFIEGQPSLDIGSELVSDPSNNILGWHPNPEDKCTEPIHSTLKAYCESNGKAIDPLCTYDCASQRRGLWKEPLTMHRINESLKLLMAKAKHYAETHSNYAEKTCNLAHFARRFVRAPPVAAGGVDGRTPIIQGEHVNKTATKDSYLIPDESDPLLKPEFANGLLKRIGECPLHELDPLEVIALLNGVAHGRPILFTGDSMMRHIFLRLVMFLRGKSVVAGRPFQCNAVYIAGEKGDVLLRMHDSLRWDVKAINSVGKRRVTLLFGWDPYMQKSVLPKLLRKTKPAVVVMGFFYWWDFQKPSDILPMLNYLGRWLEYQDVVAANRGRGRLGGRGAGSTLGAGATADRQVLRRLVLVTCPPMKKTHSYGVLRKISLRNDLMELWRNKMLLSNYWRKMRKKGEGDANGQWGQGLQNEGTDGDRDLPPTAEQLSTTEMAKKIMLVDYEAFSFWRRYPLVDLLHYQCSFVVRCLDSRTMDLSRPWSPLGKPCNRTSVWRKGVTTAIGTHQDYASCSDRMNGVNTAVLIHQLVSSAHEIGDVH